MRKIGSSAKEQSRTGRRAFLKSSATLLASVSGSFIRESSGASSLTAHSASGSESLFGEDEYRGRWQRVQEAMAAAGYENVIIWQRSAATYDKVGNVYWLTHFVSNGTGQDPWSDETDEPWTFAAVLMRKGQEPELHVGMSRDYIDESRIVCGKLVVHEGHMAVKLAEYLRAEKIQGRVAVVGDDVYPGVFDRVLRRLTPQIDWVTDQLLLQGPQTIKSPHELEVYRSAGALVTTALTEATHAMIAGERACEAAARAAAALMRGGGGFHRISISHGPASQVPVSYDFYGYDMRAPGQGDLVSLWIYGPILAGYWMDPGRTVICGRPAAEQRILVERCAKLVADMVKAVAPGITSRELGIRWENIARTGGYLEELGGDGGMFGHGLGAEFPAQVLPMGDHETGPFGYRRLLGPLKAGMVLTAEAFLTRPGAGTAGFENNFIVTDTGTELLDRTPMLFW